MVTGSLRAVSMSKPKLFFAFPAAIAFTSVALPLFEPFWL
jgi:hypothetical protein